MPSAHRRIGLVVDDDLASALQVFRALAGPSTPEARLAREAVFDGTLLAALIRAAERPGSQHGGRALALLRDLRALLPDLGLPERLRATVDGTLEGAERTGDMTERRRRQQLLLTTPNRHGQAALAVTEAFDELDVVPR